MSLRLHQISEDDLTSLEHDLPLIMDACFDRIDNRLRMKFRSVKEILSNVRWGYGPPLYSEKVPAEDVGDATLEPEV